MPASFAALFLAALFIARLVNAVPSALVAFYLAASTLTFFAYAFDKSAARKNQRRIRENTLHAFGFACGWPGALIAQSLLRHKSRKQPFGAILWSTALLHCGAFAAYLYAFPPALNAAG